MPILPPPPHFSHSAYSNIEKKGGKNLSFRQKLEKLPQKIIEEWNRIAHRGISFNNVRNKIRGLSGYEASRKAIAIGKDGRVHLPNIETYLADGCNLKCEFCTYLNPFRTGIVSKESLVDSFEKWSRKIFPKNILLMGGEPLLNSDIAEIVVAVKHYWSQSRCEILSNGVLLSRVSEDVLRVFKKYDVFVGISEHVNTQEYRDILKQSLARLNKFRVRYSVNESMLGWINARGVDADGVPIPCYSNSQIAYERCNQKRCTVLRGDFMYRCSALANMIMAVQEGAVGPEWNRVLSHNPVTFESSPQDIVDYLKGGSMPECSVCPEKWETVEARQLSMEDVQRVKQHIRLRRGVQEAA